MKHYDCPTEEVYGTQSTNGGDLDQQSGSPITKYV